MNVKTLVLACALAFALTGCGSSRYDDAATYDDVAYDDDSDSRSEAADEARQAVFDEHGADEEGAGGDASEVDPLTVGSFGGYPCTVDCSGHEAGFEWARDKDIADEDHCGGNSQSFIEGCMAFAQERQDVMDFETMRAGDEAAEAAYEDYESAEEDNGYDDY